MTDPRTPAQIEADIEVQRDQLAHTVDQLTAKLDVKSRTQAKIAALRDRSTNADGRPRPEVAAAAGALLAVLAALVVRRVRRSH